MQARVRGLRAVLLTTAAIVCNPPLLRLVPVISLSPVPTFLPQRLTMPSTILQQAWDGLPCCLLPPALMSPCIRVIR